MSPIAPTLLQNIIHTDGLTFEQGITALRQWRSTAVQEDIGNTTIQLISSISAVDELGESERSRRTHVILDTIEPAGPILVELATNARSWRLDVKAEVVKFLPDTLRRLVYGKNNSTITPASDIDQDTKAISNTKVLDDEENLQADENAFSTVLLLGAADEHESNLISLKNERLLPLRVDSREKLSELLDQSVCAIVIAKTWWALLPQEDHVKFLEQVLSHSTFTWVKMDETGYNPNPWRSPQDIERAVRLGESSQVNVGEGCHVTRTDIINFKRSSQNLSSCLQTQLTPGDVRAEEAKLLLSAISQCVHNRHFTQPVQLERVPIAIVAGGRSTARIYRIEPDDDGPAVIAKLDKPPQLMDEMKRFRQFIKAWDDRLHPSLHYHAGIGAIVFTLVDEPGKPGQIAPTLEDKLHCLMYSELRPDPPEESNETDLQEAITRSVKKLADLNRRPIRDFTISSLQWLSLDGLNAMLSHDTIWHIPIEDGVSADALSLRSKALEIVNRLNNKAVIHGDVHLRNVLLRDDRDPFFIDYAYSGPGHPCYDLVRFESALAYQCMRMTTDEEEVAEMVTMIMQPDITPEMVYQNFQALSSSPSNRLAIRGSILCRNACLRLLPAYGGSFMDYLAVKYIIACQSLTFPQLQTGIIRGHLIGLARLLNAE